MTERSIQRFKIQYEFEGMMYFSEEYVSLQEAYYHFNDIKGYDGIENCKVLVVEDASNEWRVL